MTATDPAYFEALYRREADPWKFATSAYERDKYAATLAALPDGKRFTHGFEVGCSIGILTRQLADRCDALLGVDVSDTALAKARKTCADLPHVSIETMAVPGTWPDGTFDLIVFSEVLYYLGVAGIAEAARRSQACLLPGGRVVLVNWRGDTGSDCTGGDCTGDQAASLFIAHAAKLSVVQRDHTDQYRIDVLG